MKIASFNINNINCRSPNVLSWLREAGPDIVCLQDLKAADTEFPADAIRQAGYHAVWLGEKRWNGVAILAQWTPVMTRVDLPGDASGGQCRDQAAVNGVLVASVYAPNGNPIPAPNSNTSRLAKVAMCGRPSSTGPPSCAFSGSIAPRSAA
jgi:exodeoxyribonuclease-3